MPGVTSLNAGPRSPRNSGASCAEHTTPSAPLDCASAASRDTCRRGQTGKHGQIAGIHAGQHGDGNEQRAGGLGVQRLARGFDHAPAAAGVHVHHPHAQVGGHLAGGGDGVGMSWEFQVEKHLKPRAAKVSPG